MQRDHYTKRTDKNDNKIMVGDTVKINSFEGQYDNLDCTVINDDNLYLLRNSSLVFELNLDDFLSEEMEIISFIK